MISVFLTCKTKGQFNTRKGGLMFSYNSHTMGDKVRSKIYLQEDLLLDTAGMVLVSSTTKLSIESQIIGIGILSSAVAQSHVAQ